MSEFPQTGELNKEITLQDLVVTYDSENQPVYTPTDGPTIHAKVTATKSETIDISGQKTLRTYWKIVVRHRDDFPYKQCLYRGKTLRFQGDPLDILEARQFLLIEAVEDVDRG